MLTRVTASATPTSAAPVAACVRPCMGPDRARCGAPRKKLIALVVVDDTTGVLVARTTTERTVDFMSPAGEESLLAELRSLNAEMAELRRRIQEQLDRKGEVIDKLHDLGLTWREISERTGIDSTWLWRQAARHRQRGTQGVPIGTVLSSTPAIARGEKVVVSLHCESSEPLTVKSAETS
jgi:hypothetical protein